MDPGEPAALAEITEAAAAGITAERYGELRSLLGVTRVALFYRHLATRPGLLEAAVGAARAARRRGQFRMAERIAEGVALPRPAAVPVEAFALLRLEPSVLRRAAALVAGYNRANLANLVVVAVLRGPADPHGTGAAGADAVPAAPAAGRVTDLEPEVRALIGQLSARYGTPRGLVPSFYRDLAAWPGFLALCSAVLFSGLEPAVVGRQGSVLRTSIEEAVLGASSSRPAGDVPRETLDAFGRAMGTQYVIGRWLLSVMPGSVVPEEGGRDEP